MLVSSILASWNESDKRFVLFDGWMEVGGCLSITFESPSNEIEDDFYCGNGILSNGSRILVLSLWLLEWNCGDASSDPAVFDSEEGKVVLEVVWVRCGVDTSKGKFVVKFDGLILQMSLLVISSLGFELASSL